MSTAVPAGTERDAFKRVAADKAMEDVTGRPKIAHGGEPPTVPSRRPHIVIIGAGFGGLSAAIGLGRAAAAVTVIDQRNHHLFQPLLYQVAPPRPCRPPTSRRRSAAFSRGRRIPK
jgi:NADPH-dependent 2,4-dienoyl-CoA reductase/sulfur reductase-like enzyme